MKSIVFASRRLACTLATAGLLTLLPVSLAWAGVQPQPFRTGLFGIAEGQAIRVSLLNAANQGGTINPCFLPDPVVATVVVRDLLGRARFEAGTEKLLPGMGTFVDVAPDPKTATSTRTPGEIPAPARRQLRLEAVVQIPVADDEACQTEAVRRGLRRQVQLTLEVYDVATGRTAFTMPFVAVAGIDPEPF
jgi:hypothetical protein